jgi:hypothetical protein
MERFETGTMQRKFRIKTFQNLTSDHFQLH